MIFPFNNYRKTRKVIKKKLKYIYFFSEFSELFFFLVFFTVVLPKTKLIHYLGWPNTDGISTFFNQSYLEEMAVV